MPKLQCKRRKKKLVQVPRKLDQLSLALGLLAATEKQLVSVIDNLNCAKDALAQVKGRKQLTEKLALLAHRVELEQQRLQSLIGEL